MRGDEWIRDANIVIFNKDGQMNTNQKIGLGVNGKTSSAQDTKSLKIISNNKYSDNKIDINLYSDEYTISNNSFISDYSKLLLNSGGQEMIMGNIRDSVIERLVEETGFDGYVSGERALVFINGKVYGIFTLQEDTSSSFLSEKFLITDKSKIEKYSQNEQAILKKLDFKKLFESNFNNEVNRNNLEENVDIENYLMYHAIEILINNTDWPQNNYKVWKYTGENDTNNKYTDGKCRFLLYDLNISYYAYDREIFEGIYEDIFKLLLNGEGKAKNSSFKLLMNSKYYRNKFVNLISDLLNTSFKEENILKIVDEEYSKIQDSINEYPELGIYANEDKLIEDLKNKVRERDDSLIQNMEKYFEISKKYELNISLNCGAKVYWNNIELYDNDTYNNQYYKGTNLEIDLQEYPGYTFDYWMVNNQKIYNKQLVVNDNLIINDSIDIKPVLHKESGDLIIDEISADLDWIKIYNNSNEDINLSNYYISDNDLNYKKYNMPNINLKSNEEIIFSGKNEKIKCNYILNFNIKNGETLYLSKNENIIDMLLVNGVNKGETYGRYKHSNTYKFYLNR